MKNTSPLLSYQPAKINAPGTLFEMIDFSQNGKNIAPFKGGRLNIEPGATSKLDQHQVREFWLIAAGKGILIHDGEHFQISPGNYFFFNSMETHQVTNTGDELLTIHSIWWEA